jgi:hypothetical protein
LRRALCFEVIDEVPRSGHLFDFFRFFLRRRDRMKSFVSTVELLREDEREVTVMLGG